MFTLIIFVIEMVHIARAILRSPLYSTIEQSLGYVDYSKIHTQVQIGFTYVLALAGIFQSFLFCILFTRLINGS